MSGHGLHGHHSLECVILISLLCFHSHKLSLDKLFVGTFESNELVVGSTLNDLTLVQDDDLIGILDGTQAMSDNDDGLLAHSNQLVEGRLHLMLTLRVQGTGGFVQEENLRLADQSTSDGYTLLLPARKLDTSSSDKSLITIREKLGVSDEIVDRGLLAGIVKHIQEVDLSLTFSVSIFNTVEDVVSDGIVEENGLLLDNSDLTVVPSTVEKSDITAIEGHLSGKREVELLQHGDATRLSTSTSSDEGNDSLVVVVDLKADVVKRDHVHLLRVRECDVFKSKMSSDSLIVRDVISILSHDFRNRPSDLIESFVNSLDSQDVTNDERHHPELEDKRLCVKDVLGKHTDSDLVFFVEAVRHVADDRQSSVLADLLDETETGSPDLLLDASLVDIHVSSFKLINFGLFSRESLHGLDVSETLEGIGGHAGLLFSDKLLELFHAFSVTSHGTDADEKGSKGHSSQLQVDD